MYKLNLIKVRQKQFGEKYLLMMVRSVSVKLYSHRANAKSAMLIFKQNCLRFQILDL